MKLKLLSMPFSVCQLKDTSAIPWNDEYLFLAKTDDELSLVCDTAHLPGNATTIENGWRALKFEGTLDFALIGILAKIATVLAEAEISIFAVSTFNTDYILIKEDKLEAALKTLTTAGYEVE